MSIKVCIDAGHYSKRNQSPVVPEYWESVQMWKLHLLLKAELQAYGIEVTTTREEQGKDLKVFERGKMAKGCDLFLSLHSNAVPLSYDETTTTDRASVYAPYDNLNKAFDLANLLAEAVQECMGITRGVVKTRKSETSENDFYGVMKGARYVGCPLFYIIEHSFHTNAKSARWLLKEDNLAKLAKAEAKVIAKFYGINKPEKEGKEKTVNIELTVLRKGSEGEEVKTLQRLLLALGYEMKSASGKKYGADGDFGGATETAVKAFQKAKGLDDDGVVGKLTWNALLKGQAMNEVDKALDWAMNIGLIKDIDNLDAKMTKLDIIVFLYKVFNK